MLIFGIGKRLTPYSDIASNAAMVFRKDLKDDVEETINIFTCFMYLKGTSLGIKNAKKAFRGSVVAVIEEVEK